MRMPYFINIYADGRQHVWFTYELARKFKRDAIYRIRVIPKVVRA